MLHFEYGNKETILYTTSCFTECLYQYMSYIIDSSCKCDDVYFIGYIKRTTSYSCDPFTEIVFSCDVVENDRRQIKCYVGFGASSCKHIKQHKIPKYNDMTNNSIRVFVGGLYECARVFSLGDINSHTIALIDYLQKGIHQKECEIEFVKESPSKTLEVADTIELQMMKIFGITYEKLKELTRIYEADIKTHHIIRSKIHTTGFKFPNLFSAKYSILEFLREHFPEFLFDTDMDNNINECLFAYLLCDKLLNAINAEQADVVDDIMNEIDNIHIKICVEFLEFISENEITSNAEIHKICFSNIEHYFQDQSGRYA